MLHLKLPKFPYFIGKPPEHFVYFSLSYFNTRKSIFIKKSCCILIINKDQVMNNEWTNMGKLTLTL